MRHEDNTEYLRTLWTGLGELYLPECWVKINFNITGAAAPRAPESALHRDGEQEDRLSSIPGHEKLIPR